MFCCKSKPTFDFASNKQSLYSESSCISTKRYTTGTLSSTTKVHHMPMIVQGPLLNRSAWHLYGTSCNTSHAKHSRPIACPTTHVTQPICFTKPSNSLQRRKQKTTCFLNRFPETHRIQSTLSLLSVSHL